MSLGDLEDVPMERAGEGWSGRIGGFCPVQGKGTVDGLHWYFRARGVDWSFRVWNVPFIGEYQELPDESPVWEADGEHDNAGWMKFSEAWELIEASIKRGRECNWGTSRETQYTDKPVCPHCGYVEKDDWEIHWEGDFAEDTEVGCNSCGKYYFLHRSISITYSSEPLK